MKEHLLYLREGRNPVACIAILNDGDKSAYQISQLSHKDHNFDKPLARQIALGRLKKHPIQVDLSDVINFHDLTNKVIKQIAMNTTTPSRAKKAARFHMISVNHLVVIDVTDRYDLTEVNNNRLIPHTEANNQKEESYYPENRVYAKFSRKSTDTDTSNDSNISVDAPYNPKITRV